MVHVILVRAENVGRNVTQRVERTLGFGRDGWLNLCEEIGDVYHEILLIVGSIVDISVRRSGAFAILVVALLQNRKDQLISPDRNDARKAIALNSHHCKQVGRPFCRVALRYSLDHRLRTIAKKRRPTS